jgi:glycosyltransferase involved in cell wall biosynthesis
MNIDGSISLNPEVDNDSPLISIIINCYNGDRYLREAVDSVMSQTYQNWELIFWDNQSDDQSEKIFKEYNDLRLQYFYAQTHTRLYEARNYALEKTKGKFIAFLDVDDWWEPTKLEQQILLFSDDEVGLVYSNYWIENTNNNRTKVIYKKILPSGYVLDEQLKHYTVGMLTMIVRRKAVESLSYAFDPRYQIIGDFDLSIRLAVKWKFASIQYPLAHYRMHDNNLSTKHRQLHNQEIEQWFDETSNNHEISIKKGYHDHKKVLTYLKGLEAIESNELIRAVKYLLILPFVLKLKLLLAIILPNEIIKTLRGR